MRAGLEASTVTPGSTAPDVSRTAPARLCAETSDGTRNTTLIAIRSPRTNLTVMVHASAAKDSRRPAYNGAMTTPISRRDVMKNGAIVTTSALVGARFPADAGAEPAQTAPRPAAPKPTTYVVAHGAWSSGWAWKKMHPLMQARGHRLFTPSYTGLGERAHLAHPNVDLETHITRSEERRVGEEREQRGEHEDA